MSDTINFGIDLGTTNSSIAKYEDGEVLIFKNPISLKQTLPSVVGFRKNRMVVGEKARELLQKDARNVIGSFKRKIGTSDQYWIESQGKEISPIELSSIVLTELKNFIHTQEKVEVAVVTIPASFDTIQSNATKEAALKAGFEEVVLLQEPIAASLAYANKSGVELKDCKWLVYDFGGGTFDVALISIKDGEMKVLDHEGDNYLGGTDLDKAILQKILVPRIMSHGSFASLKEDLNSQTGDFGKHYNFLLYKAEEIKINLSNLEEVELEIELEDTEGEEQEIFINVTRAEMEEAIRPIIQKTHELTEKVIRNNDLEAEGLHFILMVGGSTYVPAVRKSMTHNFYPEINFGIDPTTAVAEGAAYYAGIKRRTVIKEKITDRGSTQSSHTKVKVNAAYNKLSQNETAPILLQFSTVPVNASFRIYRSDGGFDSGLKALEENVTERVSLVKSVNNVFHLRVQDKNGNLIAHNLEDIKITQGKFRIDGQPLPFDISLELDSPDNGGTFLEPIFKKGDILPLKKSIVKQISKNILRNSSEELIINVLEGPIDNIPSANKSIGFIRIAGEELERDLVKGSDVDLEFVISESRDLKVNVYLNLSDQEFEKSFNPTVSHIDKKTLKKELKGISRHFNRKVEEMASTENFAQAGMIQRLQKRVEELLQAVEELNDNDQSDKKYQIDSSKRALASDLHKLFGKSYLTKVIEEYYQVKSRAKKFVDLKHATENDKHRFQEITTNESVVLGSSNATMINKRIDLLEGLIRTIRSRKEITDGEIFFSYSMTKSSQFTDAEEAKRIIKIADESYEQTKNAKVLIPFINLLSTLIVSLPKEEDTQKFGTGLK